MTKPAEPQGTQIEDRVDPFAPRTIEDIRAQHRYIAQAGMLGTPSGDWWGRWMADVAILLHVIDHGGE